jgi:biotin synthase
LQPLVFYLNGFAHHRTKVRKKLYMCLTIPAKIIAINEPFATVETSDKKQSQILISSIPDARLGDWILYISNLAIKKISADEAGEIIELLESAQKIDITKLDAGFQQIIKASKSRDLTKDEIIRLLKTDGLEKQALFSEANVLRKTTLKDFICIHGIIEFSNNCQNDCLYCGLRKENTSIPRYRLTLDEIVKTAVDAVNDDGYKLLVLQSGEDRFYTDDLLVDFIKKIKAQARVFIFMSVGERDFACYEKMKTAGASGVLLRFESSNPKIFNELHPVGKNLDNRLELLKKLGQIGYYIATGSIIGLPGQTIEDLADDISLTAKLADMVSSGPFVPCDNTPLFDKPKGDVDLNLKMIAILRLMVKNSRIPVVTALETLGGEDIRKRALQSGANSLMFNLTPAKYRPLYKIYPGKFFQTDSLWQKYGLFKSEESYQMIENSLKKRNS